MRAELGPMTAPVSAWSWPGGIFRRRAGLRDQNLTNLGGGIAQRRAAVLHRMTARCVTFIDRPTGVGGDETDLFERDFELLGHHLRQGCADALAQLGFARERGDLAVRIDADPGIQRGILGEAAGQLRGSSLSPAPRGRAKS